MPNTARSLYCRFVTQTTATYLPEVVDLPVDERLVLALDVIDVLDVAGVQVLLHHEAQEAVIRSVSCKT